MICAGSGTCLITGELGRPIQGATVSANANSVRDEMEANCLYLTNEASSVLMISCDVVAIPSDTVHRIRASVAAATGIPERSVIVAGTHMHSGPSILPTKRDKPIDTKYLDFLVTSLETLARSVCKNTTPARIGHGKGHAQIGYNRRCCWTDGSHTMHGNARDVTCTGLEGPDDDEHFAIFVQNMDGQLKAIVHANTSHPTTFYGADFYSSDFPGAARQYLRDALGEIPVLYLNGAFGDMAMNNQYAPAKPCVSREAHLMRAAHLLAGETLRLLHETHFEDDPPFSHSHRDLDIAVRLPSDDRLSKARAVLEKAARGDEKIPVWDELFAFGVDLLYRDYAASPRDTVPVHAIRIGDMGIVSQPCELFCHFGKQIKRRSPFPNTAIWGIADGYCGYCPTLEGILGGGYSGEPIHWTRLAENAGYHIVDEACAMLYELHHRQSANNIT